MSEEKAIVAVPSPAPDLSIVGPPPKRKKGRPPKNRPGGESTPAPALPKPDGRGRKPKRKNGDVVWPAVDSAYVGQQVHGVLDGSFDAGYLLTVRVGNTQTVLRGAVFEPSLSVPISECNDIAPNVKFVSRGDFLPVPPSLCLTAHANASTALPSPSVVPPVSSGNNNTASAPMEGDKRPLSKVPSAPLAGSPHVPLGVVTDNQKDMASAQVTSGVGTDDQKSMAPPQVTSGGATDDQKSMAPPVQSRDNVTEEKMDMQIEPQS